MSYLENNLLHGCIVLKFIHVLVRAPIILNKIKMLNPNRLTKTNVKIFFIEHFIVLFFFKLVAQFLEFNPCHPKTKRDSMQCFSLSDWLGEGSDDWGGGIKEEEGGGGHIHTVGPLGLSSSRLLLLLSTRNGVLVKKVLFTHPWASLVSQTSQSAVQQIPHLDQI